jgi:hypothetical protein
MSGDRAGTAAGLAGDIRDEAAALGAAALEQGGPA